MGFTDLLTDAGATVLNTWLSTRSYIVGQSASQADVAVFKALSSAPDAEKYPHAARWYKHIASYESEFATLPGDAAAPYSTYGPENAEGGDDDDVDLFGSDEEEDEEAARVREERLAEDEKVSIGDLEEEIQELEDYVQSTDVAAMQKL